MEKLNTSRLQEFKLENNLLKNYNLALYTNFDLNITQNLDTISLEDNNSFQVKLETIKEEKQEDKILSQLDSIHKSEVSDINNSKLENQEENLNWQKQFLVNVKTFNKDYFEGISSLNEAFNENIKNAIENIAKYQKNVKNTIISNNTFFSNTALTVLSLANDTSKQLNELFNSAINGDNIFNKYKSLKDSILSYSYVTNIKNKTIGDPISLSGLTYIKAKNPTKVGGYGPSFLMLKTSQKTLDLNEDFLVNNYKLKRLPQITNFVKDVNKSKIYNNQLLGKRTSLIHDIIINTDFQMQYYLAYFTKVVNDEESLVKLYIKTAENNTVIEDVTKSINSKSKMDNTYYYFFYTDKFNFKPIKKSTANLQYGAFKTVTALNNPDGKNVFSFNVASDLELTFWEFMNRNGLGINTSKSYFSNDTKKPIKDRINLNFVMNQSWGYSQLTSIQYPTKIEDMKVNKFVLEDVEFSELKNLNFTQSFSQMKLNVSGTYKKLKWYHNLKFSEI